MKTLFFLLLPISALCQSIEFFEGAGINPRHFESIGKDEGWVEWWAGPMAIQNGQVFKITLPEWEYIDTLFVFVYNSEGVINKGVITPKKNANGRNWFGIERGSPWGVVRYKVKRKKA